MKLIENMNYRYNNPDYQLPVDQYIVEAFLSKARSKDDIDQMKLWSSMSSEAKVLESMLENVKEQTKEESYTKVA